MRVLLPWLLLGGLACGPAPPAPAPQPAGPVATVDLPAGTNADAPPLELVVPQDAAQVRLRMSGLDLPADELTAELEGVASGDVRRWPVDALPAEGSTMRAVTVPGYAVAAGDHVLTIWQGDADLVRRYAFRVLAP